MSAGSTWQRIESSLADYCSAVGLEGKPGLNWALRELLEGIVWESSVQLTNAARRFCKDAGELHAAGKRLMPTSRPSGPNRRVTICHTVAGRGPDYRSRCKKAGGSIFWIEPCPERKKGGRTS